MYKCTLRSKGVITTIFIVVDYEVFRRLQAYFVGLLYLHCFVFLSCILYLLFCNFGAFNLTGTVAGIYDFTPGSYQPPMTWCMPALLMAGGTGEPAT